MRRTRRCALWIRRYVLLIVIAGAGVCARAWADEGMWTFDNPPLAQLRERYGFTPTQDWLDHIRLASVRFSDGGSGAFVSPNGLVLTNHHVALMQLQKMSTPEKDYVRDGFYARTPREELKCPDLALDVLVQMEDVTARVNAVVRSGMSEREAFEAQRAEIARIERESREATGLHSEVVALYHGAEYWLYRYKRYTDVRLVFAPEQQIAFFGGDPDNFTYPRYCLDFALFRVYENGRPIRSAHYLRWNSRGASEGELVFVSGHPGRTSRWLTVAQLETLRDVVYPRTIKTLQHRLRALRQYAAQGPEPARQAAELIFSLENAVKAYVGEWNGLRDPALMAKKQREEEALRARLASRPEWQAEYGSAWAEIAAAEARYREQAVPLLYRSVRRSFSDLIEHALTLVRYATEVKKPDAERLDGFHDAQLEAVRFRVLSPAPIYPGLEEVLIAASLQESLEELGPNDPFIEAALGGRSPEVVARELVRGTRLTDVAVRQALLNGGEEAIAASPDPLIQWARRVDPILRQMQRWFEENVASVRQAAGAKIGRARFAVFGKSVYPDATFTLRLAYGTVRGYPMNGTQVPPKTTFYGLFDRAHGFDRKPPYHLPARVWERRHRLDLSTPLNFVSTCDITGGNSGSPVINRQGELVGVIFDGNIESLVGNFVYIEETNRAVAVHSAAILEALRKLYDAAPLADELEGKTSAARGASARGRRAR